MSARETAGWLTLAALLILTGLVSILVGVGGQTFNPVPPLPGHTPATYGPPPNTR